MSSSSAGGSRPVHPCITSLMDGTFGAQFAVWSNILPSSLLPQLVVGQGSTLRIYSIHETTGKLILEESFVDLAGNICWLQNLPSPYVDNDKGAAASDCLLIGFCGHPRITIVSLTEPSGCSSLSLSSSSSASNEEDDSNKNVVINNNSTITSKSTLLTATTLIDLTQALLDASMGSVSPLEQDLIASLQTTTVARGKNNSTITLLVILGGGITVAAMTLQCHRARPDSATKLFWTASDPYLLPLVELHASCLQMRPDVAEQQKQQAQNNLSNNNNNNNNINSFQQSIAHGFGDILSACFLAGYLEPTIVLLHSNTARRGRVCSARLGRFDDDHENNNNKNDDDDSGGGGGTIYGMICTAINMTPNHRRSAVLWSTMVPADAISVSTLEHSGGGCLVQCVNTLVEIDNSGQVLHILAVNGWARTTCPTHLLPLLESNPWPLAKLAIQLDGARLGMLPSDATKGISMGGQGFMTLRNGGIYMVQKTKCRGRGTFGWCVVPLGQRLGSVGEVACQIALPLMTAKSEIELQKDSIHKVLLPSRDPKKQNQDVLNVGMLFVGSHLGDSTLLGYSIKPNVQIAASKQGKENNGDNKSNNNSKKRKRDDDLNATTEQAETDDFEIILQREEDALYANDDDDNHGSQGRGNNQPDIIPPSSDEEDDDDNENNNKQGSTTGTKVVALSVLQSMTTLDSITALGPLGPGCEGPISAPVMSALENDSLKMFKVASSSSSSSTQNEVVGTVTKVMTCGHGSSGGLALLSCPGRDDSTVLAEADCLNAQSLFSLPSLGMVMMSMKQPTTPLASSILQQRRSGNFHNKPQARRPTSIFRTKHVRGKRESKNRKKEDQNSARSFDMKEVDLKSWCGSVSESNAGTMDDAHFVLSQTQLLSASELQHGRFAVVVAYDNKQEGKDGGEKPSLLSTKDYHAAICVEENSTVRVVHHFPLQEPALSSNQSESTSVLLQISPFAHHQNSSSFGCVWSNGMANVYTINADNSIATHSIGTVGKATPPQQGDDAEQQQEVDELKLFYQSNKITSLDIFEGPKNAFHTRANNDNGGNMDSEQVRGPSAPFVGADCYDDEEKELYCDDDDANAGRSEPPTSPSQPDERERAIDHEKLVFVAVTRQSGIIQVFNLASMQDSNPLWEAERCGHGVRRLAPVNATEAFRLPKSHKLVTKELRMFYSGSDNNQAPHPKFYIAILTSLDDVQVYKLRRPGVFTRESLRLYSRPSKRQVEHHGKLKRKGIVAKTLEDDLDPLSVFRPHKLHRFSNISKKSGLFAASSRPTWFVSERGCLVTLNHRSRHVAPAGGRAEPVTAFCGGVLQSLKKGNDDDKEEETGFITLHERIGRVGSQRVTIFNGLGNVTSPHGALCGGAGYCVTKIPMGVTVHRVDFINDSTISSGSRPLYALLISRELETDQSALNADELTIEQRREIKDQKEAWKIKRQVEADLGGFDLEQEWVEEIERENCFEVDLNLGGAPPIPQRAYALWIVDASSNWNVVDSYEFGEFEHGMTMKVMYLTDVDEDPGSTAAIGENVGKDTLFITVGTGIVDADGEDVSGKGRVLLFEINRQEDSVIAAGGPVAELSLVHEKEIFHGPVLSLSCMVCEGRSRLIIGAGADVNVEQWGRNRLTQVGFFRGNMQILDIMLFKTFFLLSDAYDSLYFLVWRESDKSLTLLAKDYEPIPVFAAGVMSRGPTMSFVCHDDRQNLQFFQYAPGDAASRGGNKLVCRADIHLGSQTVSLESHFCRSSLLINSSTPASTLAALKSQDSLFGRGDDDQKLGMHFGTIDGGLGSIVPVSERDYWRLAALQSVMANALESNCSLNIRAWRLYRRTTRRGGCRNNERRKGVIDGDLVLQYCDLSTRDQEDLASAINSTMEDILDTLLELRCASMIV